jgi:hypothetical protein
MSEKEAWAYQLDWLNIVTILGLDTINQIPEEKRIRVTKKLSKLYGSESLLSFKPQELDELVASELKNLMEKELRAHAKIQTKRKERIEKQMKNRMPSINRPGVIPIDLNDLKDLPDEVKKMFSKMFMQNEGDDDGDDDSDDYNEDKNSYYI